MRDQGRAVSNAVRNGCWHHNRVPSLETAMRCRTRRPVSDERHCGGRDGGPDHGGPQLGCRVEEVAASSRTLQRARVTEAKASLYAKVEKRSADSTPVERFRISTGSLEGPGYEATPIRGSPEHHDRFSSVGILCAAANTGTSANWPLHNLDLAGSRFSTLDQINTSNVAALVPGWLFQHGVIDGVSNQTTPVVVDGVMCVTDSREASMRSTRPTVTTCGPTT